jgi:HAD superfamily hydrolase (TIGR01549 family)
MDRLFEDARAVLFDMDGTLVETNIDFARMKREMVALAGTCGIAESEVAGLDILAVVERTVAEIADKDEARQLRARAFRILEEIEVTHVEEASEIPGASDLLMALRAAGLGVGIVTRNSRRVSEISLTRAGITADVFLSRDDVRRTKPHPEHLLEALALLGAEPSEAVMVGDHWMDIRGGKAAGTRTVGFLRPDRPEGFFDADPPDLIVRDLAELLDHFRRSYR